MSQVILFDLDGTLTESGEGIINCVQYALEKLGKKEEHPENLQCFIGPPLKEQFMKYAGLSEEEGEKAVVYYRERYTTTGIFENRLYPKIPELLELLKINNKILAVASSKPEVYVKQILEHFQIADYFILHRDRRKTAFDTRNLVIWVIGFVLYRILMNVDLPVGNTLPDMIITIILCVIAGAVLH